MAGQKNKHREINLFVAGYGVVGEALVELVKVNGGAIEARTGKRLKVAGLANSTKFLFDAAGLDLQGIGERLMAEGLPAGKGEFFEKVVAAKVDNALFVDCTASAEVPLRYEQIMRCGCSVVACNKIGFSLPYGQYRSIMDTARDSGVEIRFETTVGAALPILETIARSVNSGDRILKIEAVLSGTLNYLFSRYRGSEGVPFASVVAEAKALGYTEPDPMIDLSGVDVLRKLIIVARQGGIPLEMSDVEMVPLLPGGDLDGCEEYFAERWERNRAEGRVDRFVASLVRDDSAQRGYRARIGLEALPVEHPFASLEGTDNAFYMKSEFYPSGQVIIGAGAGARQTASGVLNDILLQA